MSNRSFTASQERFPDACTHGYSHEMFGTSCMMPRVYGRSAKGFAGRKKHTQSVTEQLTTRMCPHSIVTHNEKIKADTQRRYGNWHRTKEGEYSHKSLLVRLPNLSSQTPTKCIKGCKMVEMWRGEK